MSWSELYPHSIRFSSSYYTGCTADLHWWLAEYIGAGMYIVPSTSLSTKFDGRVNFKLAEDAVRFTLSNPFKHPVDMTTD